MNLLNERIKNMFCPNCGKELAEDIKFCPECGKAISIQKQPEYKKDKNTKQKSKKVYDGLGLVILIICGFCALFAPDTKTPRDPQNLECINYKNLCIATTDVKYNYTAVKAKTYGYPAYGKEWNNGWASAQKAC